MNITDHLANKEKQTNKQTQWNILNPTPRNDHYSDYIIYIYIFFFFFTKL